MPPTKKRPRPDSLPRQNHLAPQAGNIRLPREDIHRIVHEVANQLTVINLSCSKLRGTVAKLLSGSSLDELERVERAVLEMTTLVRSLRQVEEDPQAQNSSHAPSQPLPANVYQVFDFTQER